LKFNKLDEKIVILEGLNLQTSMENLADISEPQVLPKVQKDQ